MEERVFDRDRRVIGQDLGELAVPGSEGLGQVRVVEIDGADQAGLDPLLTPALFETESVQNSRVRLNVLMEAGVTECGKTERGARQGGARSAQWAGLSPWGLGEESGFTSGAFA